MVALVALMPREGTPAPEPDFSSMTESGLRNQLTLMRQASKLHSAWGAKAATYVAGIEAEMKKRGLTE